MSTWTVTVHVREDGTRRFADVVFMAAPDRVLEIQQRGGSRTLFAPGAWYEATLDPEREAS